MDNQEKDQLRQLVIRKIEMGRSCQETIASLKRLGYKANTIRRYYKTFLPEKRPTSPVGYVDVK